MVSRLFRGAVAVLLTSGPPAFAHVAPVTTTEVLDLRVGLTPGRTRIVFDLSEASRFQLITLDNPARVVVDIPASTSRFDPRNVALRGTPIDCIRSEVRTDASLRYEFEVEADIVPKLFALKPSGGYGHRLVLDLYMPGGNEMTTPTAPKASVTQLAARDAESRSPQVSSPQSATKIPNPVNSRESGEWSGSISLQTRLFFKDPAWPQQDDQNASVAVEPKYYRDWADGSQSFAFSPFARYDANDDKRTHADIRELYWRIEQQQWVFKAGIDVVFWGVTESQHMVDIINQTDLVEDIDGEEKLGQPMVNADYLTDNWGTWQVYILPYFRERTFPGKHGRLRIQPAVDTNDTMYESGDKQKHVDYALRWSQVLGDWDVGLAHFTGTSRDPLLIPSIENQKLAVVPYYQQIDQTSLDAQATKGAWLWKLEALYNDNSLKDYYATVGGFEYTQFGVLDTPADLGWLLEYHYDERGENALSNLQNDLYAGIRVTGNDMASTQLLAGVIVDMDNGSTFGNIEAVRRLGESWTITLETRLLTNIDKNDPLYFYRDDDYIELQLSRYF